MIEQVTDDEAHGFIGERYDEGAGLRYLNARYYDPELGVQRGNAPLGPFLPASLLQPDWFEVTEAGVGTNRYAYSGNDPVNASDPGGNIWKLISSGAKTIWRAGKSTVRDNVRGESSWRRAGQNLRDSGVDEFVGVADSGYTIFAPNVPKIDRLLAAVDLATGFDFGGKRADTGLGELLRRDGTVYDGPGAPRLPQDGMVDPTAPSRMSTNRPIGQSATQNAEAQRLVDELDQMGARDIRVNQQQVNAAGQRVGTCRPDIQCTLNGQRVYIELDRSPASRAIPHAQRLRSNDPYGIIWLRTIN